MAPASSATQKDQIRIVMIEAARTQMAAVQAGVSFWSGWVDAADRYAAALNDELAKLEADPAGTGDLTGRLTDITRAYLRELTELPSAAVKRFNTQLEQVGTARPKPAAAPAAKAAPRKRAARAKE